MKAIRGLGGQERWLLAGAIGVGLGVRIAYALAMGHHALAGDQIEYNAEGRLIAQGHLFWTRLPYGIPHAGAWKAPGYPAWVGLWYTLAGEHPTVVRLAQVPLGAVTIFLSWLLARRLFGVRVASVAAYLVALYPLAWQYEELLYSESLATPLTLAILIVFLTRPPTRRRALLCGALLGLTVLVRTSAVFLLAGVLVTWIATCGSRRGIGFVALTAATAILVVAPWTVRNAVVLHGFVPVSLEDAAAYGTFNAQAANDPAYPYAWRPEPPDAVALFDPHHPLSDITLRARLIGLARSYVVAHPLALPKAFFWNGLTRLWDVRSRARSLVEVPFEGRSRFVSELGLDMYDVLLPLALLSLWRARRRRALVLGVLAVALAASVVFTADSGTRYRATLEPLIAVLACAGALGARAPGPAADASLRA
jgi:4-amino-4-deoxy-L-arabinose transferase-like glycosyltransferase